MVFDLDHTILIFYTFLLPFAYILVIMIKLDKTEFVF